MPVTYRESIWTGKRELLIGGVPAAKQDRKTFVYADEAGMPQRIAVEGNSFTGVSLVTSSGKIQVIRPFA